MPIGRFARLCRLSVKQLRHYDDLGLLSPAWVDPSTGYRYYRADQARAALSVGLLRSLDVPLAAIGQVLAGKDVADVLGGVRDRMEADLVRRRRMLATLDRVLVDGLPAAEVQLTRQDARRVVFAQGTGSIDEIAAVSSDCAARLTAALEAAGQQPLGPLVGLFPLDMPDELTIKMAAPVEREIAMLSEGLLAGGLFAAATHVGPYHQISLTAHALLAWIGERGHVPTGEIREVYLSDPRRTAEEHLITQLMIKIEED